MLCEKTSFDAFFQNAKSGEYHFIFIAAKKSDRTLEIADYTRKFTASGQSLPGAA